MQFILYTLLFQKEDDIYLKTLKLGWIGFFAVFSVGTSVMGTGL